MDNAAKKPIALKTNDELQAYLNHPEKYLPKTVKTAIDELQKRGKEFTVEELEAIRKKFRDGDESDSENPQIYSGYKTRGWKHNVVKDDSAPVFYSQYSIFVFSILFGVIFGGIMLAINIRKAGHKNIPVWIAIFGTLYSITEIIIFNSIDAKSSMTYIGNALGALVLDFFWQRYIGYKTLYKAKPIWIPLIIALLIYIPILLLIIYGNVS